MAERTEDWQDDMRDLVRKIDGLFTGQLDTAERQIFEDACKEGLARRVYEGAAGFMGLAKVRVIDAPPVDDGCINLKDWSGRL
jgi:hypothetical protein